MGDRFQPSPQQEQEYPAISGLAKFSRSRSIGVRDAKLESDDKRLILLHNESGALEELDVDWAKTGRARDLEAITPSKGSGSYLAVEGSSFEEHKARLFDLKVTADGGESKESYLLPEFGQEIEGLLAVPNDDGTQTVLFGGRGDESGAGRVYWGNLSESGLTFTNQGLAGQVIDGPDIGPGRRSISDLALSKDGQVWATAAVDDGDSGAFGSAVYHVGELDREGSQPILLSSEKAFVAISGTKAEGLAFASDGSFLMGSDNENRGGRVESFSLESSLA